MEDSETYKQRKGFFAGLLTIYGRKPVLEALHDSEILPYRLHLADSNRNSQPIKQLQQLAESRGAEVVLHSREALSRISKNRRQDQGVVLDIEAPRYQHIRVLDPQSQPQLIALENVTNPQNVGMAIRSVGASPVSGIILPKKGSAPLDAQVVKSSAGVLFKSAIFYCDTLLAEVADLKSRGYRIIGMTGAAQLELQQLDPSTPTVFVLGNETSGLSPDLLKQCDEQVKIPMSNAVESLNVSVAAALVAFRSIF